MKKFIEKCHLVLEKSWKIPKSGPGKMTFGPGKVLEKSWNFVPLGWWEP
jgi:hypothetical protein